MEQYAMIQYGVFLLIVTALVYPFGGYLTRVFAGESTWLDPGLRPLEQVFYRLAGIDAYHEMDWKEYASAFLVFSAAGTSSSMSSCASSRSYTPLIPFINLLLSVLTWR